jgi:hypothetical protein
MIGNTPLLADRFLGAGHYATENIGRELLRRRSHKNTRLVLFPKPTAAPLVAQTGAAILHALLDVMFAHRLP